MKMEYKSCILILLAVLTSGLISSQATELPYEKGILDHKVPINLNEVKLVEVLDHITIESGIEFLSSPQRIDCDQKVTAVAENESRGQLPDPLPGQLKIGNALMDGSHQILLFRKEKVNQISSSIQMIEVSPAYLYQVDREVSGAVTDAAGVPLLGVNIVLKSQPGQGTITDSEGKYILEIPDDSVTLVFSYIGYKTQEITVTDQSIVDVVLQENFSRLDEIVVVGYGTQKKSDVTGSVSVVDVDKAITQPTTNFAEMLRGQAAGVRITLDDPRPGGNSNIVIRGNNSILGGNSPLFIVDGVPLDNINDINTADITSIEILKDASAQAILWCPGVQWRRTRYNQERRSR